MNFIKTKYKYIIISITAVLILSTLLNIFLYLDKDHIILQITKIDNVSEVDLKIIDSTKEIHKLKIINDVINQQTLYTENRILLKDAISLENVFNCYNSATYKIQKPFKPINIYNFWEPNLEIYSKFDFRNKYVTLALSNKNKIYTLTGFPYNNINGLISDFIGRIKDKETYLKIVLFYLSLKTDIYTFNEVINMNNLKKIKKYFDEASLPIIDINDDYCKVSIYSLLIYSELKCTKLFLNEFTFVDSEIIKIENKLVKSIEENIPYELS